ncbi:MAG: YncE family protein [Methylacidiphilales bacterium]|nr:YncE family protein [Candidatus Methylacidiphilales bacterium]
MKIKRILSLACCAILSTVHSPGAPTPWSITSRIHIGGDGGWDYLTIDPETSRLFVSHAKQVVVVDLKTKSIIGSIAANGVHGIALAPDLQRGFISNGADGTVTIFDLTALKTLTTLPAGKNPDAICYEPTTHRVFAFNGGSGTATVIDAAKQKVIGEIPLEGKPEFAAADGHGSVFNALEDKSQILKINADTLTIDERWNLPEGSDPSGVAIDPEHERLFIGCRNRTLVVLDGSSGKAIASLPIGEGVDACVYDAVGKRAFASCGDGTMTVVQQSDKDAYVVAEKVITEPRARTMAFDSKTGTAYLPIAKLGPMPPATAEQPKPRPTILPDTLELLVLTAKP